MSNKRFFDLLIVVLLLIVLLLPILLVAILVKVTSKGPVLYWSKRVGKNNTLFRMPKFRSMRQDTPAVATHLLTNPESYLTPIGGFIRKTSLDELPQIWSILIGDMSLVGPRPALYNQDDLIKLRTDRGVHKLTPGLTGWAQINGRDELPISHKVALDETYLVQHDFYFDIKILAKTIIRVLGDESVKH